MKAHVKYLSYIVRHKWFVFQAGLRLNVSLWRLLKHDWSKFLPSEWFPYVAYFYGEKARLQKEESDDCRYWQAAQKYYAAFDRAWLHHQHRNDHHWQHWMLRNDDGTTKCLPMPEKVWREMIADWMGAGRAITGKWECAEWYAKNRDKIQLHPATRASVDAILNPKAKVK